MVAGLMGVTSDDDREKATLQGGNATQGATDVETVKYWEGAVEVCDNLENLMG